MKKFFIFSLCVFLIFLSFFCYQKLEVYQQKNEKLFLSTPETNVFRKDYLVLRELFDFYKLLHMKKPSKVISQQHICLFKNEIFKKNKIWQAFNQKKLEKTFNSECEKTTLWLESEKYWKFNNWFCNEKSCHSTSFYYKDYIITEDKIVFHQQDNRLTKLDFNQFMQKTFDLENPEKNIILYIRDSLGIGNQMFQYWANYIYAQKKGITAFLIEDIKSLKVFHLPFMPMLSKKPDFTLTKCNTSRVINIEKDYPFLFNVPISVLNFKGYEKFIIENTKFKEPLTGKSNEIAEKMQNEVSVSIHVRRGDFITNGYKLLKLSYYQNAVKYMKEKFESPHFYVFSDDINWAKENLKIEGNVTFVDWTTKDYEDLHLMTKTKHNIIANSSFSWWGAFLNKNENKIVLIPETGFYNEGFEHMKVDENWIVIKE